MNPLESFSLECDASGIERRVESSANTSTKDGWMTYEYAPIGRDVMNVETKSVTVKCGNLEIKPPSEGRIWGSIWLDGIEMPFVTSVKLTWEVPDIWRCEIGHIVDERVTGKKKAEANEQETSWRDREPML